MEKTAAELVALVRTWTGKALQTPWRDGFAADAVPGKGPYTILSMLNEAQRELAPTGYIKCPFSYQVTAGRLEYSADPWMGQWLSANYQGKPLKHVSVGWLDRTSPGWRTQASGVPTYIYKYSDQIGLFPAPNVTDGVGQYSLVITADALVSELANPSDVPVRLPARLHEALRSARRCRSALPIRRIRRTRRGCSSWFRSGRRRLQI